MADIQNFLTMHPDDIPETQVLPEGSYDFVITSYRSDKVGEKQNEIVRINVKAQAVLESDITDGNPVISLKSFLFSAMGMDKVGFGEALEQSIGQTFSGVVKHEMVGRNKDILQASVSRILKAA